jgi:hypothetical protein
MDSSIECARVRDGRSVEPRGPLANTRTHRAKGEFLHVPPKWAEPDRRAGWIGQRLGYSWLKASVFGFERANAGHRAFTLANSLPAGTCGRTLATWANIATEPKHKTVEAADRFFAQQSLWFLVQPSDSDGHAAVAQVFGPCKPMKWATSSTAGTWSKRHYLAHLVFGTEGSDFRALPGLAGAWARHVHALNIVAQIDRFPLQRRARAERAAELLAVIHELWSPQDGLAFADTKGLAVPERLKRLSSDTGGRQGGSDDSGWLPWGKEHLSGRRPQIAAYDDLAPVSTVASLLGCLSAVPILLSHLEADELEDLLVWHRPLWSWALDLLSAAVATHVLEDSKCLDCVPPTLLSHDKDDRRLPAVAVLDGFTSAEFEHCPFGIDQFDHWGRLEQQTTDGCAADVLLFGSRLYRDLLDFFAVPVSTVRGMIFRGHP